MYYNSYLLCNSYDYNIFNFVYEWINLKSTSLFKIYEEKQTSNMERIILKRTSLIVYVRMPSRRIIKGLFPPNKSLSQLNSDCALESAICNTWQFLTPKEQSAHERVRPIQPEGQLEITRIKPYRSRWNRRIWW